VFSVQVREAALSRTPDPDDGRSASARGMVWASRISSLGLELALPILGGFWLDRQWGTKPWFFLVGALIGISVFGLNVARLSRDVAKKP
jgi:F0F1-type ATP synthase assembly protein I